MHPVATFVKFDCE